MSAEILDALENQLVGIIEDVKGMHPEYIVGYLKDQLDILRNGI